MERILTTKGMILDICSMTSRAIKLTKVNKNADYCILVEYLAKKDYYYDDDLLIPTITNISNDIGLNPKTTRKLIVKLYDVLVKDGYESNLKFSFEKVEYIMFVTGFRGSTVLKTNHLPIIPRKGENINIPYFNQYVGTTLFHVSDISHELCDNKQEVNIWLQYGAYSSYWDLRKSQAEETGEISSYDILEKSDREIKDELNIRPFKAW